MNENCKDTVPKDCVLFLLKKKGIDAEFGSKNVESLPHVFYMVSLNSNKSIKKQFEMIFFVHGKIRRVIFRLILPEFCVCCAHRE